MTYSVEEIYTGVIEVLTKMKVTGDAPIDVQTDPLGDLGFISDDGLDFACEISVRFDFHFPNDRNPFIDDNGHRSRRVGEIVHMIAPMLAAAVEARNG